MMSVFEHQTPVVMDLLRRRLDRLEEHLALDPTLVHRRYPELDFGETAGRGIWLNGATLLHVAPEFAFMDATKIFRRRIGRGADRVARALQLAAQGCHHAKNALGAFYRRIQARSGSSKAIVATARKLAERVYRLLKYGQDYVRQSQEVYESAYHARLTKSLAKKAAELGYKLIPETMTV